MFCVMMAQFYLPNIDFCVQSQGGIQEKRIKSSVSSPVDGIGGWSRSLKVPYFTPLIKYKRGVKYIIPH